LRPLGTVSDPKVTVDAPGKAGDSFESARLAVPLPLPKVSVTVYGAEGTPVLTLIFDGVTAMLVIVVLSVNLYCAVSPDV
jgi:hypothetical protein